MHTGIVIGHCGRFPRIVGFALADSVAGLSVGLPVEACRVWWSFCFHSVVLLSFARISPLSQIITEWIRILAI